MVYSLICDLPSDVSLRLSIPGREQLITGETRRIDFDIPDESSHEIRIESLQAQSLISPLRCAGDLLLLIPRGLALILLMEVDSEWYRWIQPWSVRVTIQPDQTDRELFIQYQPSRYLREYAWTKPAIAVIPDRIMESVFQPDVVNVRNGCYRFIRSFSSAAVTVLAFFSFFTRFVPEGSGKTALMVLVSLIGFIWLLVSRNEWIRMRSILTRIT